MDAFGRFLAWVVLIALAIPSAIYAGFVFTELWVWFAVPLGAPKIGIAHALGLSALFGYPLRSIALSVSEIQNKVADEEQDWLEKGYKGLLTGALYVSIFWGFGAIYHYFMPPVAVESTPTVQAVER